MKTLEEEDDLRQQRLNSVLWFVLFYVVLFASYWFIWVLPQKTIPPEYAMRSVTPGKVPTTATVDKNAPSKDTPVNMVSAEKRFQMVNEARKTNTQILGGAFFLLTAVLTWRSVRASERSSQAAVDGLRATLLRLEQDKQFAEANLQVTQDKQASERLAKATDSLGSSNPLTRVGGIYSLERAGKESIEDRAIAAEIITAFIRQNAVIKKLPMSDEELEVFSKRDDTLIADDLFDLLPPQDVQAGVTVLGRRFANQEETEEVGSLLLYCCDFFQIDFRMVDKLFRPSFYGAIFTRSLLVNILATDCDFRFANCNYSDGDSGYNTNQS